MYACITHTWVHCICEFQVIVSQIEHGWHFNTHEHIMWWSLPFCRTTMTLTIQDEKSTVGPTQFFCLLLWVSLTPRYSLYFQWLCLQMHSCTLKVNTHSKESIDLKGLKHCIFLPFFPLIACCLHFTRSISQNNSMSHLSLSSRLYQTKHPNFRGCGSIQSILIYCCEWKQWQETYFQSVVFAVLFLMWN